jgi:hypothetical protein|eukprot:COSAG01_NODE_3234_length_6375_cov_3.436036_4_plen_78_part_00
MRYAKPVPCETRDDKQAVNLVDVMEISCKSEFMGVCGHSLQVCQRRFDKSCWWVALPSAECAISVAHRGTNTLRAVV